LDRIDQSAAGPIIPVKAIQVLARNQERGDPFAVLAYPDFGQVAPACQQKSPSEDVRGLKDGFGQ
jgi:hypothetical protein